MNGTCLWYRVMESFNGGHDVTMIMMKKVNKILYNFVRMSTTRM